jgi:hypothetical protein
MEKKKKAGRKNLPKEEYRIHQVIVRMSSSELDRLNQIRGKIPRARFIRETAFRNVQVGGGLDRNTFAALARVGNNINQIAKSINTDGHLESHMLLEKLNELEKLIGMMKK